jgi:hypothetical protein
VTGSCKYGNKPEVFLRHGFSYLGEIKDKETDVKCGQARKTYNISA